jgi:hypothetical protein
MGYKESRVSSIGQHGADMGEHDPKKPAGSEEPGTKVKKPYAAPVLVECGSLMDLTQSVGQSGSSDGGHNRHSNRTG